MSVQNVLDAINIVAVTICVLVIISLLFLQPDHYFCAIERPWGAVSVIIGWQLTPPLLHLSECGLSAKRRLTSRGCKEQQQEHYIGIACGFTMILIGARDVLLCIGMCRTASSQPKNRDGSRGASTMAHVAPTTSSPPSGPCAKVPPLLAHSSGLQGHHK